MPGKENKAKPIKSILKKKRLSVISETDMESVFTTFDNPVKKLHGLAAIVIEIEMNKQMGTFNVEYAANILLALTMMSPKFKEVN